MNPQLRRYNLIVSVGDDGSARHGRRQRDGVVDRELTSRVHKDVVTGCVGVVQGSDDGQDVAETHVKAGGVPR